MTLHRLLPCAAACALGFSFVCAAHADAVLASGNFGADNSEYFTFLQPTSATNYTFTTTSFASGGFLPVLTLFNTTTGAVVDYSNPINSDASISDVLGAGYYELFLTENPNVAVGNLSDGFFSQYYSDAEAADLTGYLYDGGTGQFLDDTDGSQRTSAYSLDYSAVAATPEPASWLLMLPGVAGITYMSRRRRTA